MGASGNQSNQNSNSTQQSQGWSNSWVSSDQQGFLSNLWKQATGTANPQASQQAAQTAQNQTLPGLLGMFASAGQAGNSPQIAALANPQGQIKAQTDSLRSGLNQQWQEDLLPALRGNAIQAGGFGGGRQGVAEGVAAGGLMKAFTQGRGDIVANANNQAMQAQGQLANQRLAGGALGGQLAQAITAAQTLPSVAGLDPLARLAQILGSPTVLNSASQGSTGSSTGSGKTGGFGFSFT